MNEVISKSLKIKAISPPDSMEGAHIFNSSCFLGNKSFEVKGWQLIKEKPIAQIFFYIHKGVAISGYQSTFGSFDVVDTISKDDLSWFIKALVKEVKKEGVSKIKVKQFPSYFANSELIEHVLIEHGFKHVLAETNQHIIVKEPKFEEVGNRSEVLRSNKCDQLGYQFKIVSQDMLPQVYKLVEETLARKGNKPSMSFANLKEVITACPTNYILFTLWDNTTLVAATVSIKINSSIVHNFYHADRMEYRLVSSLTFLLKNIYLYCLANNFKVLDLGTSSVNGVLNKGLFKFKKTRGANSTCKNYYNLTV